MEVELFACYVPVHVDGNDGFVLPLGSRLDEELVVVEDEGCHGVASGMEKESPLCQVRVYVHIFIAYSVSSGLYLI